MVLANHSLKWLFWGNIWVATGAASVAFFVCRQHLTISFTESIKYTLLVYFSTLSVYITHRLIKHSAPELCYSVRHYWILNYRKALWRLAIFSGVIAVIFGSVVFSPVKLVIFSPVIILVLIYTPFYRRFKGLRSLPAVKNVTITVVWVLILVVIPLIHYGSVQLLMSKINLMMGFTLFIGALTLPFDLRDRKADTIKTLATIFSRSWNKIIAVMLLVGAAVCFYANEPGSSNFIPLIAIVPVLAESATWQEIKYDIYFDGLFILFGLSLFI
jgi:hypothetical protein